MASLALLAACHIRSGNEAATNTAAPAADAPTATPTPATSASPAATLGADEAKAAALMRDTRGAEAPPEGNGQRQPRDQENGADHPAVSRYEGIYITRYERHEFDTVKFAVGRFGSGEPAKAVELEGRATHIKYAAPKDRSTLEVFRSYQQALGDAGFTVAFRCELDCRNVPSVMRFGEDGNDTRYLSAMRPRDGVRVGLEVTSYSDGPLVVLDVLDPKLMQQGVKVVDAAGINSQVAASGRAVLYAIQFDTDKATLRPESDAQLKAISDWLTTAKVKALVVGHTDSQGAFPYNVGLSQRRAEAVVAALTSRYGIARDRLTPFGNGMAAPVASNRTPEGQARNRRVEVVEQP